MSGLNRSTISALLVEVHTLGSESARNMLFDAVYDELHRMAQGLMKQERTDHTLRPTALVHEAFIRMAEVSDLAWESRVHFFGIAARAMRHVLVDHARERGALKRGGGRTKVTLSEGLLPGPDAAGDLLVIHDALDRFARLDERAAKVAELRIFAGLTSKEIAHVLDVSRRTADGEWITARTWLSRELSTGQA